MADQPHDALFRETFRDVSQASAELRAVLPAEVVALFDWDSLRLESGTFVSVADRPRRCDLLFSIERNTGRVPALVFVLFEHQSSNDGLMPLRILRYLVRVWDTWVARRDTPSLPLPPILPVVLSHDDGGWRSPTRFRELFDLDDDAARLLGRFVPDLELVVDDIAQATDEDLAARSLPPTAALTLWALRDGRSARAVLEHAGFWAPVFELLAQLPGGRDVIDRLIRYLGIAAGERSVSPEALAHELVEHGPNAKRLIMNSIEKLIEKGRKEGMQLGREEGMQLGREEGMQLGREEGRQLGREEGRTEGQRSLLLDQLRHKFGSLDDAYLCRVQEADGATLERYAKRLITADSLAAVFGG